MPPPCDCRRLVLVPERGAPPTGANHIAFCKACGLFYVTRTTRGAATCSTFRLTARHLKALDKVARKEATTR